MSESSKEAVVVVEENKKGILLKINFSLKRIESISTKKIINMKTTTKYFPFFIITLLFTIGSCKGPINQLDESFRDVELKKGTLENSVTLSQEEIDGILFMREEEKLAHDVYVKFYNLYAYEIFLNISESEQKHTDAVLQLINFYGLKDPALLEIGEFRNEELQDLYDLLMSMGTDLISALEVGVLIELTDLEDITALMQQTEVKNILQVYGNLLNGSLNHLESFESALDKYEEF